MTVTFEQVMNQLEMAKSEYNAGHNNVASAGVVGAFSLDLLLDSATMREVPAPRSGKSYFIWERKSGQQRLLSRPCRADMFLLDVGEFSRLWKAMVNSIDSRTFAIVHPLLNDLCYTCALAFACMIDLYYPASRKTPGTFFELLIGTLIGAASALPRTKQIRVPDEKVHVPTDIVIQTPNGLPDLVIPTKITTRERIVQAFVHQRILDVIFGTGKYRSVLFCVSETQREGERAINDICVPEQVYLFQRYVAPLNALYYFDPPAAYVNGPFIDLLPVRTPADFFGGDLARLATSS